MDQSKEIIDSIFGSFADSDDDDEQTNANNAIIEAKLTEIRDDLVGVGGHRGLFALCPLPPGTMVVSEVPTVTWGGEGGIIGLDDPDNLANVVELCCCNPEAYAVTQVLHPRSLVDCDEIELTKVREILSSSVVTRIAQVAGHIVDTDEVFRVVLVLQHNGFGSGLYRYLTMLNHSCNPNCVKYSPSAGFSDASYFHQFSYTSAFDFYSSLCLSVCPSVRSSSLFSSTHFRLLPYIHSPLTFPPNHN